MSWNGRIAFLVVYLIAGFSAPFIFKNAPSLHVGGQRAGTLFFISALTAIIFAFRAHLGFSIKLALFISLFLQLIFWTWRWQITTPLAESYFLGLSGSTWHKGLTVIYLLAAAVFFIGSKTSVH